MLLTRRRAKSSLPGAASGPGVGPDASRCGARRFWLWVAGIAVLAALLRIWALDHGLPDSYYADESHFVKRSVAFGTGDLNPHWFHKPAFFMYVLFFEYGVYFLIGKVVGWWSTKGDFAEHFFNDAGTFYLIGRATATLAGIGIVVLVAACGRRISGPLTGLIAALFMAGNLSLAEAGRWVKADVPCAFFTLLATYWLIRVMDGGKRRHYWLAGLAIGIGTATKYYALALIPAAWLVHWLRPPRPEVRKRYLLDPRPWEATLAAFLGFFVCSPYNILDGTWWDLNLEPALTRILTDKLGITFLAVGMAGPPGFLQGAWNFLKCMFAPECMGLGWGALAIAGLTYQLARGSRVAWVPFLAACPFVVLAVLWNPFDFEPRYLSAILPMLALAAATVVSAGWTVLTARWPRRPEWLGLVVLAVLVAPSFHRVVEWNRLHARKDTRTLAAEWIEAHIPAGTGILNDNDWVKIRKNPAILELEWTAIQRYREAGRGGPFLSRAKDYQYRHDIAASRKAAASGRPTYRSFTLHHPWWSSVEAPDGDLGRYEADLDMGTPWPRRPLLPWEIKALGIRYIVTTAKTYRMYRTGGPFAHFKQWAAFYRWIRTLPIVYTVPYQPEARSGPTVRIYAVEP